MAETKAEKKHRIATARVMTMAKRLDKHSSYRLLRSVALSDEERRLLQELAQSVCNAVWELKCASQALAVERRMARRV
jgi:hypothetical protein